MSAPTRPPETTARRRPLLLSPSKLAQWRFISHAQRCKLGANIERCQRCRSLHERADIEAGQRWGWPDDERSERGDRP